MGGTRSRDDAEKTWLPSYVVEATTRQSYRYIRRRHILPEFRRTSGLSG